MSGSLDELSEIPAIQREVYWDYDLDNKPNSHCNWQQCGFLLDSMAWVENDDHYRKRILIRLGAEYR